jgi:lysophospholipase L1-like esterase
MGTRRRRIGWTGAILAAVALIGGLGAGWLLRGAEQAAWWEDAIVAFEEQDREAPPAPGAIVFTGSSSIRMWKTLEDDMAPRAVLNRGFGGAHLDHVNTFASRIVLPYAPRAIVLYAGDNDIAAGKDAERVTADFERFVTLIRAGGSDAPILFVAIKPSRLRFGDWPEMARANAAIAARCAADARLHYVDVATPMLAEAEPGQPPPRSLFQLDGLHLSAEGYALWTRRVRAALDEALGSPTR